MFSDHEQRALREVEQRIAAEDPGFARALTTHQQRLARHDPRRNDHRRGDRIALTVAGVLAVAMAIAGAWAGALAMVTATGLAWVLWRTAGSWAATDDIDDTGGAAR